MGGDPIPGPHDMLRLWYRLPDLEGDELDEAVATLEEWLARSPGQAYTRRA